MAQLSRVALLAAIFCSMALPALVRAQMEGPAAEPLMEVQEEEEEEAVLLLDREPMVHKIGGDLGWAIQPYEDITDALVGDTLLFEYTPFHSVWQVPEKACNFEDGSELAGKVDSPFELLLEEPGVFYFSDFVPGRCEAGKLFGVTVYELP